MDIEGRGFGVDAGLCIFAGVGEGRSEDRSADPKINPIILLSITIQVRGDGPQAQTKEVTLPQRSL